MFNRQSSLPTEFDLPETDHQPVDNELQVLIPALLRAILVLAWQTRNDWFMGINLGVYYEPQVAAIGPDAFLSLGVPTFRENGQLRLSYVVWDENNVVPQWVLEIVSKTPGQEYADKFEIYQEMGVLYYVIYNPDYSKRDRHETFEVYRLENGKYVRQSGNPVWMPELDLGIGVAIGVQGGGKPRQWLYWYDEQGNQLPAPENVIARERSRAEQAERQLQEILERLRSRGIDPEQL